MTTPTKRDLLVEVSVEDSALGEAEPLTERFEHLLDHVLAHVESTAAAAALSVLVTDDATLADLNNRFRGKAKATNVLSFPAVSGTQIDGEHRFLGDIALATGVIAQEANHQGKALETHLCHLVIHGILHLLGYDHETDHDAEQMEQLETVIMRSLGLPDPYEDPSPAGEGTSL